MDQRLPAEEVVRSKDGVTQKIRRLTEVAQILPRLEKDRFFAAYAIKRACAKKELMVLWREGSRYTSAYQEAKGIKEAT